MVGERRQEEQREHGIERQVKSAFVSVTSFLRSQHLAIIQPVQLWLITSETRLSMVGGSLTFP